MFDDRLHEEFCPLELFDLLSCKYSQGFGSMIVSDYLIDIVNYLVSGVSTCTWSIWRFHAHWMHPQIKSLPSDPHRGKLLHDPSPCPFFCKLVCGRFADSTGLLKIFTLSCSVQHLLPCTLINSKTLWMLKKRRHSTATFLFGKPESKYKEPDPCKYCVVQRFSFCHKVH
jgi:hypothetical protein